MRSFEKCVPDDYRCVCESGNFDDGVCLPIIAVEDTISERDRASLDRDSWILFGVFSAIAATCLLAWCLVVSVLLCTLRKQRNAVKLINKTKKIQLDHQYSK